MRIAHCLLVTVLIAACAPEAGPRCGDDRVDLGERCDGTCPASCDDGLACTRDVLEGAGFECTAWCRSSPIVTCVGGDGCCPVGCTAALDGDCSRSCGNGVVEPLEVCDGDCPTSCNDGVACTDDILLGSPAACSAVCAHLPIGDCSDGDGCCPVGCSAGNDADCDAPDDAGMGIDGGGRDVGSSMGDSGETMTDSGGSMSDAALPGIDAGVDAGATDAAPDAGPSSCPGCSIAFARVVAVSIVDVVLADDGTLYSLETVRSVPQVRAMSRSGVDLWTVFPRITARLNHLTVADDGALLLSGDGEIVCLEATGTLRWSRALPAPYSRERVALGVGDPIYVTVERQLHALDLRSGADVWTFRAPDDASWNPVRFGPPTSSATGIVYTEGSDTRVYAIGPDGTMLWRTSPTYSPEARSLTGPAFSGSLGSGRVSIAADGSLLVESTETEGRYATPTLRMYDPNGLPRWAVRGSHGQEPLIAADGSIHTNDAGRFVAGVLLSSTGTQRWWDVRRVWPHRALTDNGRVLVMVRGAPIEMRDLRTGSLLYQVPFAWPTLRVTVARSPLAVLIQEGRAIFIDRFHDASDPRAESSGIFALDIPDLRPASPWSAAGHDARHTRRGSPSCASAACPSLPAPYCSAEGNVERPTVQYCVGGGACVPDVETLTCNRGCRDGACIPYCDDADGDGHGEGTLCIGFDCDDSDPTRFERCWLPARPWPATWTVTGTLSRNEHHCPVDGTAGRCLAISPCYDEVASTPRTVTMRVDADGVVTVSALGVSVCAEDSEAPDVLELTGFRVNMTPDRFFPCILNPLTVWGNASVFGSTLSIQENCDIDYAIGGSRVSAPFRWSFVADL